MAVPIVDLLEVIQVGDGDREGPLCAPGAVSLAVQMVEHHSPVPQAGEMVVGRLVPERLLHIEQPLLQRHDALARSQARAQFDDVERLDQEVVGAGVEAGHAVFTAIARGQQDHVDVVLALGARAAADFEAVGIRHHPVEDRQARAVGRQHGRQRRLAVGNGHDLVPEPDERLLEQPARDRVVVGYQDSHDRRARGPGRPPASAPANPGVFMQSPTFSTFPAPVTSEVEHRPSKPAGITAIEDVRWGVRD